MSNNDLREKIENNKLVALATTLVLGIASSLIAVFIVSSFNSDPSSLVIAGTITFAVYASVIIGVIIYYVLSDRQEDIMNHLIKGLINISHAGAGAIIKKVACMCSGRFVDPKGVVVYLSEYMSLLRDSSNYLLLRDVTFMAPIEPSDWGTRESGGIKTLAWEYLENLGNIKRNNPSIRMRRIILLEPDKYNAEKDKPNFNYFIDRHKEAKIDLLYYDITKVVENLKGDYAAFVGPDKNRHYWVLKSDYDYNLELLSDPSVNVKLLCGSAGDNFPWYIFYVQIRSFYQARYGESLPGHFLHKVTDPGWENVPDWSYLHSARILG